MFIKPVVALGRRHRYPGPEGDGSSGRMNGTFARLGLEETIKATQPEHSADVA
jgi:hypothetical protein